MRLEGDLPSNLERLRAFCSERRFLILLDGVAPSLSGPAPEQLIFGGRCSTLIATEAGPTSGGPDLGDQSDTAALAHIVGPAVRSNPNAVAEPASGEAATSAGGTAGSGSSADAGGTAASGVQSAPPAPTVDCGSAAATAAKVPARGADYRATLRWKGQPAIVYAFRRADGSVGAAVVSETGCAVLASFDA